MIRRVSRRTPLILLLAAAPTLAVAAGWGALLRDSPLEDFSDVELRMYLDTIRKALDAPGPPQPVEWRDAQAGSGATVQVVGDVQVTGFKECRRFQTQAYSRKHQGTASLFTACRTSNGRWSLISAD